MSERARRRAACRRWGHLPAGPRCARCGRPVTWQDGDLRAVLWIVCTVSAVLTSAALTTWLSWSGWLP